MAGTGLFLLVVAIRGLPPGPPGDIGRLRGWAREVGAGRAAGAVVAGLVVLVATGWLVAGAGAALLVLSWRGLSGAAGERAAMARLDALATWTESLRDTIAGSVGLEQAIPASLRAAQPGIDHQRGDDEVGTGIGEVVGEPAQRLGHGQPGVQPLHQGGQRIAEGRRRGPQ